MINDRKIFIKSQHITGNQRLWGILKKLFINSIFDIRTKPRLFKSKRQRRPPSQETLSLMVEHFNNHR